MGKNQKIAIFLGFLVVGTLLNWYFPHSQRIGSKPEDRNPSSIISAAQPTPNRQIKNPALATVPFKEERLVDITKMRNWILNDQLCLDPNTHKIMHEQSASAVNSRDEIPLINKYLALTAATGKNPTDPCVQALLSKNYKDALAYARKNEHKSCHFLRALILTNLLEGLQNRPETVSEENQLEAIKTLESLQKREPNNGIYSFFLLPLLDKSNATRESLEKAFRNFLTAPQFENPLIPLFVRIMEERFFNATAFVYSVEILSAANMPDFTQSMRLGQELARDAAFRADFLRWSTNFAARLSRLEKSGLGEPYILLIQEAILRGFTGKTWEGYHPSAPLPHALSQELFLALYDKVDNSDSNFYSQLSEECGPTQAMIREYLKKNGASEKEKLLRWRQNPSFY